MGRGQVGDTDVMRTNDHGTVLIVDDEEDVLRSTEMMVRLLGYDAIALQDPARVIEVAERERPGVILQDLKMQTLNLAGLVASLRSNPSTAEIPLVFFSASSELPHTAAKYDAWGYLAKPFSERELAQLLERTVGRKEGMGTREAKESATRAVRAAFHDYWNLLAALSNYTAVLRQTSGLNEADRRIVEDLNDLVLKLESKTDRLRSYLLAVLG